MLNIQKTNNNIFQCINNPIKLIKYNSKEH
jgi:hypothetical protein